MAADTVCNINMFYVCPRVYKYNFNTELFTVPFRNVHVYASFQAELSNMEVKTVDGDTTCRFRRPRQMSVFTGDGGMEEFNLDTAFYIFLAWGSVYKGIC